MNHQFLSAVFLIVSLLASSGPAMAQTALSKGEAAVQVKWPTIRNFVSNQNVKLASLSGAVRLRMTTKIKQATHWVKDTRPSYFLNRKKEQVAHKFLISRGLMTKAADKLEMKLPSKLSKSFSMLRNVNPLAIWGFCAFKFKQDPAFLMKYGIFSFAWSYLQPPALVSLGVSLPFAYSLTSSLVVPFDIAVILYRQHQLRLDPSQTIFGTLRSLGREYSQFVLGRRFENRVFIYAWPHP